jgi:hypothetical protein
MKTIDFIAAQVSEHLTKGTTHEHYDRTLSVAKFGYDMITGENTRDYLDEIRGRETREEKEQRNKLTNTLTPYLCNRVERVFRKAERATGLSFTVEHTDENAKEAINEAMEEIHGRKSLKEYVFNVSNTLNFTDPNAWLLFMFEDYDDNGTVRTRIYPQVVPSSQAIQYKEHHGRTKWLLRKVERMDKNVTRTDFYFYEAGQTVYLRETTEVDDDMEQGAAEVATYQLGNKTYRVLRYDTPAQSFPGARVGFMEDPATLNETYVSILTPAEGVLRDWIRSKSYKDVQQTLHVFLQKFTYGRRCTYETDDAQCQGGYLNGDTEHVCPSCHGAGLDLHTTEQHVIRMLLPDSREEMMPLSDLVHYANIPLDIYRDLKEELANLEEMFLNAIFNGGVFVRPTIVQTATEANQGRDDTHDSLHRYTQKVGELCELGAFLTADYLELDRYDMSVYFVVPTDYNLESMGEMLAQLAAAKNAGAPPAVVQQIEKKLHSLVYQGSPWMLQLLQSFEEFKPFRDKNEQTAQIIVSGRPANDPDRVLWENWSDIMTVVRIETNDEFYLYPYERRRALIYAEVQRRIDALPAPAPLDINPFNLGG